MLIKGPDIKLSCSPGSALLLEFEVTSESHLFLKASKRSTAAAAAASDPDEVEVSPSSPGAVTLLCVWGTEALGAEDSSLLVGWSELLFRETSAAFLLDC